ncbi:MAG: YggS family pyridoxal phosphate-dependent enzyme [Acidobacteriaceae bacterium]
MTRISENISAVRERIEAAARRKSRNPSSIALMAVCKTKSAEEVRAAYDAGQRLFGENRIQEFQGKVEALASLRSGPDEGAARFHLIGHLQSNKTTPAAELFDAVDSADSLHVLERLNAAALKLNKIIPVLLEINIGGEEQKAGLPADQSRLNQILLEAPRLEAIRIQGLMTVPPYTEDPDAARQYFRKLRELRDQIASRKLTGVSMDELSMGMSHDFEVAVEEDSTCVRVGTAIFGARNYT